MENIAHEIWAAAQLLPEEGIEDGVERIVSILEDNFYIKPSVSKHKMYYIYNNKTFCILCNALVYVHENYECCSAHCINGKKNYNKMLERLTKS